MWENSGGRGRGHGMGMGGQTGLIMSWCKEWIHVIYNNAVFQLSDVLWRCSWTVWWGRLWKSGCDRSCCTLWLLLSCRLLLRLPSPPPLVCVLVPVAGQTTRRMWSGYMNGNCPTSGSFHSFPLTFLVGVLGLLLAGRWGRNACVSVAGEGLG